MSIIFQRRTNNSIVFASTKPHSADQKETSNNYRENATPMIIRSRSQITKIYAVLFRIICTYTNYENIRSTIPYRVYMYISWQWQQERHSAIYSNIVFK